MNNQELQRIVDQLEMAPPKEDAYFGIFQFGSGNSEQSIRANKAGLQLFAAELLKASLNAEDTVGRGEKPIFTLNYDEEWICDESDIVVQYIEVITDEKRSFQKEPYVETLKDKAMKYGCMLTLLIIFLLAVNGFISVIKWLIHFI